MIDKPSIIITSLGRTGTKFFQELFADIIPDATSLHEPDYLNFGQYHGISERFRQLVRQIQESGFSNLIIRKALGKWSLIALSDARLRGTLDYSEAVEQVLSQRRSFVRSQDGSMYIESSSAYFGLIDVIMGVYKQHKVVYIIRDGRDWVQSKMNFGRIYLKGKVRSMISRNWPTAQDIENDPYQSRWAVMSRFEKTCWAWARLNKYVMDTVKENPNARVFRFEDIFKSGDRYQHLADLVNFATDMPGVEPVPPEALEGWLDRRIHKSSGEFPAWSEWSPEQKGQFREICGSLMKALGYSLG
jgi:hypothetical protein